MQTHYTAPMRNEKSYALDYSKRPSDTPWLIAFATLASVIVLLVASEASAANARSNAGLVTNNATYTGFGTVLNDGSKSAAERSDAHTRPLAIDTRANTSTRVNAKEGLYVGQNQAVIVEKGAADTTILRRVDVNRTVVEAPDPTRYNYFAPDDVNARPDAGVIISHPRDGGSPIISNATGGVTVYTNVAP